MHLTKWISIVHTLSLLFLLTLFSKWNSECDSFCLTKRNPSDIRNRTLLSCPWGQEENGATEDGMVGWHHWLCGHAFEQTGRQWRTGKPGVLQSMGSQRVGHEWSTAQLSRPSLFPWGTKDLSMFLPCGWSPFLQRCCWERGMHCACLLTIYSRAPLCWDIAWVQWYLLTFPCLNIH